MARWRKVGDDRHTAMIDGVRYTVEVWIDAVRVYRAEGPIIATCRTVAEAKAWVEGQAL